MNLERQLQEKVMIFIIFLKFEYGKNYMYASYSLTYPFNLIFLD